MSAMIDTDTITANLPATNMFAYDLNGNLRTNGTRFFDYDDENQLIRITESTAWKSEFAYDGKMRRRIRKEYQWTITGGPRTELITSVTPGTLRNDFNGWVGFQMLVGATPLTVAERGQSKLLTQASPPRT